MILPKSFFAPLTVFWRVNIPAGKQYYPITIVEANKELRLRLEKEKSKEIELAKKAKKRTWDVGKNFKELKGNTRFCKQARHEIISEIEELNNGYEGGAISKEDYLLALNEKINGRTRLEWLDFCNEYVEEKGKVVDRYKKEVRERIYGNFRPLLPVAAILLLFMFALFLPLKPTGFITIVNEFNYSDVVGLSVNSSYEYIWIMGNYGNLKSVRLDGSIVPNSLSTSEQSSELLNQRLRKAQTINKNGYAKVYLEYKDESYLILDSNILSEKGIGMISGLAVNSGYNLSSFEDQDEILIHYENAWE